MVTSETRFSKMSDVDSVANSECYNRLIGDLNSFGLQAFLEHDREKRDIEKILKLNPDAPVPVIKDHNKSPVDISRFEKIYGKPPENLSEMDSHLTKLKARI